MHCLQNLFFGLQTLMTRHFLASLPGKKYIYLKRKPYTVLNECTFDIGWISVIRACENRIVRPDLYGSSCMDHSGIFYLELDDSNLTTLKEILGKIGIVPICSKLDTE